LSFLLQAPGPELLKDLSGLERALGLAFPLKSRHRSDLPLAVRDLSHLLTSERGQKRAYWAQPRLVAAYLYYFLPWNLLRLAWLLPGLPLLPPASLKAPPGTAPRADSPRQSAAPPGADKSGAARVLDLGSGPLTLPLGLWLSLPELRARKLDLLCTDPSPHPLGLGRALLESMAGGIGQIGRSGPGRPFPWNLRLKRGAWEEVLRGAKAGFDLITAANLLNELPGRPRDAGESLEGKSAALFRAMHLALVPGGRIFLLEPGTRLGARLIARMRSLALEQGYLPEAPCTHSLFCPLGTGMEEAGIQRSPVSSGRGRSASLREVKRGTCLKNAWCHFSFPAAGAWPDLLSLSREAGLEKERLHLACLLLRKPAEASAPRPEKHPASALRMRVRVVSDPLYLPAGRGVARYVCSALGPGLLRSSGDLPSGTLLEALVPGWPDKARQDPRSGAWEMLPL
jgi:SAM-dependent methyltransferase